MQSLSSCPSRNESFLVSRLESELGSSLIFCTDKVRGKRLILGGRTRHFSTSSVFLNVARNCISKHLFSEPNKRSLGASYAVSLVLEEQAVCNHVRNETSASLDGVSDEIRGSRSSSREFVDVRALGRRLEMAKTADDVEEVMKEKGELPLQVFCSLIRSFGKEKRLDSAMALFEWLRRKGEDENGSVRPNLFIYNSILGVIKQAEKYDLAEVVVNDMAKEGINPSIVTYNTLMAIYIAQGREVEALSLFEEIPSKGLSLTPATYSTAMLAYKGLEDGFGALKFLAEVKEKFKRGEMRKNVNDDWDKELVKLENFAVRICHHLMRHQLVKIKNSNISILKLLIEMDKAGVQMSRADYERLVWACTSWEHHAVARELYNRIRERDTEISLSVCNHVIWLMGKAKKWWGALEIYEDMLDKGPKPNNMSYELIVSHFNILLTAARRRGSWRWGVRLLNKMEEKGLKPGCREWNAVLVACSKASETSTAIEIFKRMIENGEKPTVLSYGALLSALEKGRLYDEALRVWKHMIKVGVLPNLYAYTIMASIYAAQGKSNIVSSILTEMVAVGIQPTVVTYNAIISACTRQKMAGSAYEWFQRMKDSDLKVVPNEVTYEVLIEGLAEDGKPRLAYELYVEGFNKGLSLSFKAYNAVIQSANQFGASLDFSCLGPPPAETNKRVQIKKTSNDVQ